MTLNKHTTEPVLCELCDKEFYQPETTTADFEICEQCESRCDID